MRGRNPFSKRWRELPCQSWTSVSEEAGTLRCNLLAGHGSPNMADALRGHRATDAQGRTWTWDSEDGCAPRLVDPMDERARILVEEMYGPGEPENWQMDNARSALRRLDTA